LINNLLKTDERIKIPVALIGAYFAMIGISIGQTTTDSIYEVKPLKLQETNLVSSYYTQEGNHSAIRGGIGDEHVMDLANGLSLTFVGRDVDNTKHTLTAGLGIDHHTAASAAYVSKTGASKTGGTRVYPSLDWLMENEEKGTSFGLGAYYSAEYNYHSLGLDMSLSKKTKHNGQFDGKVNLFIDRVKLIYPSELVPITTVVTSASGGGGESGTPSSPRTTFSLSATYSQVINTRMQASVNLDLVEQNGYLGLPFHRVYLADGSVRVENLPSNRFKLPIGFRLNYFAGDNFIIRSYYRFYVDQWGILAHTAELEVPIKFTPFFSLSPFFRYYTQTAAYYFAPYEKHSIGDVYYSSNYALSALTSQFAGMGLKITPPNGILKTHLSSLEIRYGHYMQSTDLYANMLSTSWQFK
jgi:hypothetical protein